MRNPTWVRDEVILALDLYVREGRRLLPETHPEVIALSDLLRRLPFHPPHGRDETFRNPAGVSMVLANIYGIDPAQASPGLGRNNHLQHEVWADFANDLVALQATAAAIERAVAAELFVAAEADEDEEMFREGAILARLHLTRERNRSVAERKKAEVMALKGQLACEVCHFDFAQVYGNIGRGFAECHHVLPLAALPGERTTRLADLAVVCANCHRMLHRGRLRPTIEELRIPFACAARAAEGDTPGLHTPSATGVLPSG